MKWTILGKSLIFGQEAGVIEVSSVMTSTTNSPPSSTGSSGATTTPWVFEPQCWNAWVLTTYNNYFLTQYPTDPPLNIAAWINYYTSSCTPPGLPSIDPFYSYQGVVCPLGFTTIGSPTVSIFTEVITSGSSCSTSGYGPLTQTLCDYISLTTSRTVTWDGCCRM
jgi:hypothetical protein